MHADANAQTVTSVGRRRTVIWAIAAADILGCVAAAGLDPGGFVWAFVLSVGATSLALVGAMLAERAPANRIGAWLLAGATLLTATILLAGYSAAGSVADPPWPGAGLADVLADLPVVYVIGIVLIGVPAIFPTGHLLSPRWRVVIAITAVAMVMTTASMLIGAGSPSDIRADRLADFLGLAGSLLAVVGFVGALSTVVIRFRRGTPIERQQTKWLLAVTLFATVALAFGLLMPEGAAADIAFFLGLLALFLQPVAIGIAVLRYRLYAIDRIVSRTISYAAITVVLIAVYAAIVVIAQYVLRGLTGGGTLGVVLSTLVVASLFQPLRRRVQSAIDQRFDRRRYDADQMVATFAERLRAEVQVDAVTAGLDDAVRRAMSPATAGVWLRDGRPRIR